MYAMGSRRPRPGANALCRRHMCTIFYALLWLLLLSSRFHLRFVSRVFTFRSANTWNTQTRIVYMCVCVRVRTKKWRRKTQIFLSHPPPLTVRKFFALVRCRIYDGVRKKKYRKNNEKTHLFTTRPGPPSYLHERPTATIIAIVWYVVVRGGGKEVATAVVYARHDLHLTTRQRMRAISTREIILLSKRRRVRRRTKNNRNVIRPHLAVSCR